MKNGPTKKSSHGQPCEPVRRRNFLHRPWVTLVNTKYYDGINHKSNQRRRFIISPRKKRFKISHQEKLESLSRVKIQKSVSDSPFPFPDRQAESPAIPDRRRRGFSSNRSSAGDGDAEAADSLLLTSSTSAGAAAKIPKDSFHLAYIVYFTLGAGFLLPWNAFITAVDYFSYIYPDTSVDRIFAVVYMVVCLVVLLLIVGWARESNNFIRINIGLALFVLALLIVPVMDLVYIKGRVGLYNGYYITVAAVVIAGVADALVQGGVVGSAGELPSQYMQATCVGTSASGVLVSVMRITTKAIYPQDAHGLRRSANLYFGVSIVIMAICIVFYNVADRLPVIQYCKELKMQAVNEEKIVKGSLTGSAWRSTLWNIVGRIKWFGFGIFLIYVVTLSIFPGYITEDVHSQVLKDWYPIILIAGYNIFDLVGKCLSSVYMMENANIAVAACVARLLFYPLFLGCLHGPKFFRTEVPVTILTCLLGLTTGYYTAVLMMLAPKTVALQHAETAGIVIVLFLVIGLAVGSIVSWFWVI